MLSVNILLFGLSLPYIQGLCTKSISLNLLDDCGFTPLMAMSDRTGWVLSKENCGQSIAVETFEVPPVLYFDYAEPEKLYTLLFADMDGGQSEDRVLLHWLVVNIPVIVLSDVMLSRTDRFPSIERKNMQLVAYGRQGEVSMPEKMHNNDQKMWEAQQLASSGYKFAPKDATSEWLWRYDDMESALMQGMTYMDGDTVMDYLAPAPGPYEHRYGFYLYEQVFGTSYPPLPDSREEFDLSGWINSIYPEGALCGPVASIGFNA